LSCRASTVFTGDEANNCTDFEVAAPASPEVQSHRPPGRPQTGVAHPRGLIDGLTRFFTPSDRRGPRVCRDLVKPQTTADLRRRYTRRPRTSSPSDSVHATLPLSTLSPLLPSETPSLRLLSEPAANRLSSTVHASELEDVKRSENSSRLPLLAEGQPAVSQLGMERLKSPTNRQLSSASCGTTTKRSREQLTDGLSHFFTAVGKRRRCSAPKQYLYCDGTTMDGTRTKFVSNVGDVDSRSNVNCRLRVKFSPNKRVAAVRLKRLPTKFMWELQNSDDNSSTEKKTEIQGKTFSMFETAAYLEAYQQSSKRPSMSVCNLRKA